MYIAQIGMGVALFGALVFELDCGLVCASFNIWCCGALDCHLEVMWAANGLHLPMHLKAERYICEASCLQMCV